MSKIQELLFGKNDVINYDEIIEHQPWIVRRNMNCILSPDSDGLLCGLIMSHFLNWKIVGFYDGKVMALQEGINPKDENCAYLDMEIFRSDIRSCGHHMLLLNKRQKSEIWEERYQNCIQPNLLRNYEGKNDFRLKYPLATIHLLICILSRKFSIELPQTAISSLFFTDGVFQILYSYPENVLNWLNYLGINDKKSPLRQIFMHDHFTVYSQIVEMDKFFRQRDEISVKGERGDRLRISTPEGEPFNLEPRDSTIYSLNTDAKDRVLRFISILAQSTGWHYKEENWNFNNFNVSQFTKFDFKSRGWRLNGKTFKEFLELNPLSWAMTSGDNIEFTIEKPATLY